MTITTVSIAPVELTGFLERIAKLGGQRVHRAKVNDMQALVAKAAQDVSVEPLKLFESLWREAGLEGLPTEMSHPGPAALPFVGFSKKLGWILVNARNADGTWRAVDPLNVTSNLGGFDDVVCLSIPARTGEAKARATALKLVWLEVWSKKAVFIDAVVATALVSVFALTTSLYAMQVYDRVIPNHGYQTLWVLTVGVGLSIFMEFGLKQLRSYMVDKACNSIDQRLSEWFFHRMLSIRMEARPPSVGTLASQVKGFEMVRGVLTSTSLFVLADVPFAIFFLFVIALVGGSLVFVPLVTLPIGLFLGLMFQGAIQRNARKNLAASNLKAGLLVESVDGVETLKANAAEWFVQGRWNKLVTEVSQAEHATRTYTALSQNLTMAFQQLSYIALVAFGAYLVAENKMSMGGLIACSIIGSRAMTPMVQLPGVMVQWAIARAALGGLDQIIALPNEEDDAHNALVPQTLGSELRLERARFVYGATKRVAFEVESLVIKPGETIGLIGAIGSGKSTLLKMLSGLYRPVEGKAFLGGMDMASLSPAVVRESIGYLPQEVRLFGGSLRENLIQGLPDPGDDALIAAAKRTGLIDLIVGHPAGLSLDLTEGGRGVSGGQKQLIALTRLLLANPKVWLLDEPTGAMDAASEHKVVNLLLELASKGATLVITTHKTALLPVINRLIVVQGGRPQLDGPRDAVLAKVSGRPAINTQEVTL
jgi:ATP-binding cassette, subfamily C, bacterial LapB